MYIGYHTIFFKTLLSCFASCKDKSSCGFWTIVSLFQTVDLLKVQLNLLLKHGTAECPLLVILDSLDQLDTSHNGRSLMWLPAITSGGEIRDVSGPQGSDTFIKATGVLL
ncbi:hypothetical protein DPMN_166543 [Dreissena polymorpha]|uniref:Uncharacterized protein n=1 Tax=Dreissena polymorpha TaxID=45954 RepID=A0A9D4F2R2_DREPO|nr:hypothetical protein DPMN_166543 [Dreissena polymorpha]